MRLGWPIVSGEWQFDAETRIDPADAPDQLEDSKTFESKTFGEGHHRWSSFLHGAWNIGTTPNGGYALSPVLKALAEQAGGGKAPLSMTTHYLRPTVPDMAASITVESVKQGRRLSVFRASLAQPAGSHSAAPQERLACIASFGPLESGTDGPTFDELRPDDIPGPDECLDRSHLPQGVELPIMSRLDIRLDPRTAASDDGGAEAAVMRGWIRFGDGRPTDIWALPLFADAFPPSVFSRLGRIGWVPTLELTVHVRAQPAPGWIQATFETSDLQDGLLIEDGVLWDETGRLVARSRQLAMLL